MDPDENEIRMTRFLTGILSLPYYRAYARSLGLSGSERVLEVGCGSGALSRHLATQIETRGGSLTCLDISEAWLGLARGALSGLKCVRLVRADVTNTDLGDNEYDAAVVHFVLHDLPKDLQPDVIRRIGRAIRPAGRIFLREPLAQAYGIKPEEIRSELRGVGFLPVSERAAWMPTQGTVLTALYTRNGGYRNA